MNATTELQEILITGLKNAHAMEKQALSIMKPQVKRVENYSELRERLQSHINETEGQIERLETIFSQLEESPSWLKDTTLSMGGSMAALSHAAAGDEILKDTFANYAFEHYEIAAYKSLIDLASAMPTIKPCRFSNKPLRRRKTWPSGWTNTWRLSLINTSRCVPVIRRRSASGGTRYQ